MAKLVLGTVANLLGNPTSAANTINNNSDLIETALENTLSRDGSTPNQMLADIDLNGNDLLNVGSLDADVILIDGSNVEDLLEQAIEAAEDAQESAAAAQASASQALSSANDAQAAADSAQAAVDAHANRTDNPHVVTKAQVGLSNVPNVDATLRSNHTGTQTSTTISDFAEATDDRVAALLQAGTNITLTYNDVANTLTIAASGSVATTATAVSVTPTGGISSTNVQAALAELDTEKFDKTGGTVSGPVTTNGLQYTNVTYIGNTDLNTQLVAGFYDGNQLSNVPYGAGDINVWWFIEIMRHSTNNTHETQRAILLNKPGGAWWTRRRIAGTWDRWEPEGGVATPAHYGCPKSTTAPGIGSGAFNDTDFQAWLNHNGPIALDGWYRVTTSVTADLTSRQGFKLQGAGLIGGIVCTDAGRVTISNIGVDNPWGASFDTVVIRDLTVIYAWNASNPVLTISAVGGTSGSSVPTLHMDNVHIYPSGLTAGVASGVGLFQFNNIRQAHIVNCGGAGLYNGYQGIMFNCLQDANTAAVEVLFDNCRGAHFQKGWVLARAAGAVTNDDAQGWHWRNCAVLAVDRGWDIDGGAEGFGEWTNIISCHAYFREVGVITTNYGNLRIKDNYLLGHGALTNCQGIALTGTPSLEPWTVVKDNRIRLDAATAATRRSLNFAAAHIGVAMDNRGTGSTTANILGGVTDGGRNT